MAEAITLKNSVMYVKGLDCPDCAKAMEEDIRKLPGITQVKLTFSLGKLEISHEGQEGQILKIVEEHGCKLDKVKGANFIGNITGTMPKEREAAAAAANSWVSKGTGLLAEIGAGGATSASISGIALLGAVLLTLLKVPQELVIGSYLVAIALGGWATFKRGSKNLIKLKFDMNVLMTIAVVGAIFIGEWLEGAVIAFLFSLSHTLENYSMEKTRQSVKELMTLAPDIATVKRQSKCSDGCCASNTAVFSEEKLPVESVMVGDIVIVRPGERISMDGKVVFGSSWANEASITGESILKEKNVGSKVFAGSINEGGYVEIEVEKLSKDNTVSKIIELVEGALAEKPPVQQFIDRFASYYTPAILALALSLITIPTLILGQDFNTWFYRALALLLVACPCALIISTPVALVTAMGRGAKDGILIKGGIYLEEMARVKAMAFDKTGTITKGEPKVKAIIAFKLKEQSLLEAVYGLEKMSEHLLAKSFCSYALENGVVPAAVKSFEVQPGKGVRGIISNPTEIAGEWIVGNLKYIQQEGVEVSAEVYTVLEVAAAQGDMIVAAGYKTSGSSQLVGLISFKDVVRPNVATALKELKEQGIYLTMLTGDTEKVADIVGREVGIDHVFSQLLPHQKLAMIEQLEKQAGKVAMIGDGINDAPALAKASVGIAMGAAGTDTALETADIALMSDDITKLPLLVKLSNNTLRVIKQNIAISLGLKLLAVILIFPGWLTLWMAVLADMGTSLLVTLNGLRLLKTK
ncbi:MAG: cation-translocating P-type ATPase [Bacillota bacterium]|nr:cation-translocating P-type ATPase [Bacillota bacterium]